MRYVLILSSVILSMLMSLSVFASEKSSNIDICLEMYKISQQSEINSEPAAKYAHDFLEEVRSARQFAKAFGFELERPFDDKGETFNYLKRKFENEDWLRLYSSFCFLKDEDNENDIMALAEFKQFLEEQKLSEQ